jgi:hypothetical protein
MVFRSVEDRCGAGGLGRLLALAAALLAGQIVAQAQSPAAPKVEVRGIRIVADGYGKGQDGELRPFNWSKGTTLAILVTTPDSAIVEVSKDECELTKFADDKGTNLTGTKGSAQKKSFGHFPAISPDGKACLLELAADGVPAKGATVITASGTIALRCASRKETAKQENVALKQGTKISFGPFQIEIARTGKPESPIFGFGADEKQKDAWEVTLQAKQDLSGIVEVKFLDAAGNDMKAADGGTDTSRFGSTIVSSDKSFVLPAKTDSATIVVTYWADMKEVKLPFEVNAAVGLD